MVLSDGRTLEALVAAFTLSFWMGQDMTTTEETIAKAANHIAKLQKLNDVLHAAISDIAQCRDGVKAQGMAHKALLDYSKIYLENSTEENKV